MYVAPAAAGAVVITVRTGKKAIKKQAHAAPVIESMHSK